MHRNLLNAPQDRLQPRQHVFQNIHELVSQTKLLLVDFSMMMNEQNVLCDQYDLKRSGM